MFHRNYGLTSLKNRKFYHFFKPVCFYGQERLIFYIECNQTLNLGQICLKRNEEEISNFSPKPWTNLFGKG